jgi:hypothetical protein
MNYPGYGNARFQDPSLHWLDLPVDPNEEEEEPIEEREPYCSFAKSQALLVLIDGALREFHVGGDEKKAGDKFNPGGLTDGVVVGYILNRNPDFADRHYGWAKER